MSRFCELAALYGVPPDRLLSRTLEHSSPAGREELIIDLNKLPLIADDHARVVAEFIHGIRAQRKDYLSDVITLRSGDIDALALSAQLKPDDLLAALRPAVRPPSITLP